jgi:hypothetical protein
MVTGLLQAGDVRQMPKVLGMIETVSDQELVRGVEPDEPRGML